MMALPTLRVIFLLSMSAQLLDFRLKLLSLPQGDYSLTQAAYKATGQYSQKKHATVTCRQFLIHQVAWCSLHMMLSSISSKIEVKSSKLSCITSIFGLQSQEIHTLWEKSSIFEHISEYLQSLINQCLCQNLFFNDKIPNLQSSSSTIIYLFRRMYKIIELGFELDQVGCGSPKQDMLISSKSAHITHDYKKQRPTTNQKFDCVAYRVQIKYMYLKWEFPMNMNITRMLTFLVQEIPREI